MELLHIILEEFSTYTCKDRKILVYLYIYKPVCLSPTPVTQ